MWVNNPEPFPYQYEIQALTERCQAKCEQCLNSHFNTSSDSKLVRILKLTKWMESSLGKRVHVPSIEKIGKGVFELDTDFEEESESSGTGPDYLAN